MPFEPFAAAFAVADFFGETFLAEVLLVVTFLAGFFLGAGRLATGFFATLLIIATLVALVADFRVVVREAFTAVEERVGITKIITRTSYYKREVVPMHANRPALVVVPGVI